MLSFYKPFVFSLATFVTLGNAIAVRQDQPIAGTAKVDLSQRTGEATALGSGFIYGWPDNGVEADESIPSDFVNAIKFRTSRAGGAQLPAPASGWAVGGYEGYIGRFESALSNYRTTRKYGGDFILLPHDLWGADGGLDGLYPGDDGDWSELERFYAQLFQDIRSSDMLDGLVIDIWNEPELDIFWARPWEQYLEYYVRAHRLIREALPGVLVSGPAGAHSPSTNSTTWNTWMAHVAEQDAIPDIYSWHQIGAWEREPDSTIPDLNALREVHGLPELPIDVNEYAWPDEQHPANTVYYLAQLERYNLRGLRAHWGSGGNLHDTMADLLFKDENSDYQPNGEWYLYQYYAAMTGERVSTQASQDKKFDAFATVLDDHSKILVGSRSVPEAYEVEVSGLSSLGLPEEGSIGIRTLEFKWGGKQTDTGKPVELPVTQLSYSGDKIIISVNPSNTTAYAFEFVP